MAASMKLGSKSEGFLRRGQAWFCTTGLPSDVVVQVDEMTFHLHKFPLMSKSGLLEKLITESLESRDQLRNQDDEDEDDEEQRGCVVQLAGIPGGTESFELAAKFCYGVKLELTASNIVPLRCAAEYLEMTEQLGEGNLIVKAEGFLNQVVLRSWKDSVRALQSCEKVLEQAEKLQIVKRCVDSISSKACTDPSLFGWPLMDHHLTMQSPGGSVLWNGISTGARPRNSRSDWWYEDVASLSLSMFERLVAAMEVRGLKPDIVAGAVMSYGKRYLPGLNRRRGEGGGGGGGGGSSSARSGLYSAPVTTLSEVDQRILLETIQRLLPAQKGVVPVRFLFGLLKLSMLLGASSDCKASLEARIGMQLEQAGLDDLLMPNYSYTVETLYDIDVVQRIVEHFLSSDGGGSSVNTLGNLVSLSYDHDGSPNNGAVTPMMQVAKLMDAYLAEVAPDVNLKMGKFQALAESLPEYARLVDDGLYRAIDIYLKAHHWLTELEREKLCRTMDCQKLSLEACTHAAQNERLPLRVVVQVLFFEQLQLRTAIAGCFLVSENVEASRPAYQNPRDAASGAAAAAAAAASNRAAAGGGGGGEGWANVLRENQVMKVDMDRMRSRVIELEKECTQMRQEIEKIGNGKSGGGGGGGVKSSHAVLAASMMSSFSLAKKLGCRSRPHALKPQDVMKPPQPAPPPEDDLDEGSLKAAAAAARAAGVAAPQVRRRHRRTHSLV
ncbi:BTB/POZ domain-containing protein At1g30440-like [Selaginella moellendorffii]|uniref:BTB/POZ domain-containing protein At1g30440-like n=1 Tax=Selaginella moellendorffii TaxID=88036 RepID=UPI000D1CC102|nr:BTB/POZ domain-containing protein At1g30440-like [Selaginella moellendorffii]|eukprot:XP_024524943.1 BTB/POZ domain-containing protein At1g30440-like [Selaginella moellendorffii]